MFTSTVVLRRRIVLIDIENVAGGGIRMAQQVHDAQCALTEVAALDFDVDHIVVASGRASAEIAGFTDVLLVAGDAIFTDAVAALGAQGVTVTVASRPESLSRRLRMAASHTIELDYESDSVLEAA